MRHRDRGWESLQGRRGPGVTGAGRDARRQRVRPWTTVLVAALLALAPGTVRPSAALEEGALVADRISARIAAGALLEPASPVLEVSLGRFVGDLAEVGLRQEGGFATGAGRDDWHLTTTAFADVHLCRDPKPPLVPFAGLAAGALYDDRRVAATLGPEAGVKLFLGAGAFAELRYSFRFRWSPQGVGGVPDESHIAVLGVGFLFGEEADPDLARTERAAARAEEAALAAERSVERLERAVERLERAVDQFEVWFMERLRKR